LGDGQRSRPRKLSVLQKIARNFFIAYQWSRPEAEGPGIERIRNIICSTRKNGGKCESCAAPPQKNLTRFLTLSAVE
jgi:hypothetical protein